jgi:hypothetical protein
LNTVKKAFVLIFITITLSSISYGAKTTDEKRRERAEKAATVTEYPPCSWDNAHTYESKNYIVKTNTSKKTASYIGQLMDYAQKKYRDIFGYKDKIKKLDIHAFRSLEGYMTIGNGLANSAGVFSWQGTESIIKLPYVNTWGKRNPTKVLLHEGTHQFVHEAIDFKLPEKYREKFHNTVYMNNVPRWLNEGMATYIEVSYYDGKRLVVGEINKNRLRHLQSLIKEKSCIPLRELFKPRSAQEFISHDCYAPSWGLVYWFLHDKSKSKQKKKRNMLKSYIGWCKKGFMDNPEEDFGKLFIEDTAKMNNFWDYWKKHTQEEGFKKFIEVTVGDESKIEAWEKSWHKYILSLNPNDNWGGLRRKKKRR